MPGLDRLGGAWRMHADVQRLIDHPGRNRRQELSAPAPGRARLHPHRRTARVRQALERAPSFYRAEPIDAHVRRELRAADGSFNVRKRGSAEADHHVALYRIVEPGLG